MTDYLFGGMARRGRERRGETRWLAKWRALDWKEEHRGWFWLNQRRGIRRSLGRQTLSRLRRRGEPIRWLEWPVRVALSCPRSGEAENDRERARYGGTDAALDPYSRRHVISASVCLPDLIAIVDRFLTRIAFPLLSMNWFRIARAACPFLMRYSGYTRSSTFYNSLIQLCNIR